MSEKKKKNNNKIINEYFLYTIADEHISEIVTEYNNIIKYKTGFTGDTAMYIENKNISYLLVDGRFSIQAREEIKNKKIKIVDTNRNYSFCDFLKKLLSNKNAVLYVDGKRESISKIEKIKFIIDEINQNNLAECEDNSDLKRKKNKNNFCNRKLQVSKISGNNTNKNNLSNKNIENNEKIVKLKFVDNFSDKQFISYRDKVFHMTSAPLFLLDNSKIKLFDKKLVELCIYNAEVYITSSKEEIAYLTNLRYEFCDINNVGVLFDSFLIIEKKISYLYIHDYVSEEIEKIFEKHNVFIKNYCDFYKDLKKIKNKKINIDKSINNYHIYKNLDKKNVNFVDSLLDNLMSIRSDEEIQNMETANVIDGVSITNIIYELKNNFSKLSKNIKKNNKKNDLTEYDIKELVDNERRKNKNFLCPSFDTIVAYNENAAICHYVPSEKNSKIVKNNGILLIDSGGHYRCGTTDITRTISLYKNNKKIPNELKKNFTLVLKAILNLQNQIFPSGYTGRELDLISRRELYYVGLDYNHGTGHGIGYVTSVHLGPNVITEGIGNDIERNILEVNQVQSIEPGLYIDKKYGIRIENDTYVSYCFTTEYGDFLKFVPLTLCPIDKDLLDKKLLNDKEVEWLNLYHKKVYDKLHKYYEGKKLAWLNNACKDI